MAANVGEAGGGGEQHGDSKQHPQEAVEELNPRVHGVEYRVVVAGVLRPELLAEFRLGRMIRLGHPKCAVAQNHLTLVVGRVGRPSNLLSPRGRNRQSKALRPVGATHSGSGHSDHRSGEHDQEVEDDGPAQKAKQPWGIHKPCIHGCKGSVPLPPHESFWLGLGAFYRTCFGLGLVVHANENRASEL